ncbi:protein PTST homolog 2, chloroplastic-like isoform X2 [Tasmannia lanceolata]|uniref:protein PTST homolog 2, chloroplastic-like isoform X2 n=1 Tax=Tasmannia lanceolata TaxID=3420 RepID=UPI004064B389
MISLIASHSSIFLTTPAKVPNPNPNPNPNVFLCSSTFSPRNSLTLTLAPPLRRMRVWEVKGDAGFDDNVDDLEAEILDFMEKSPNPRDFPTKDELIAAGRMDLVVAIATQGGWLTFGWDSEEEQEDDEGVIRVRQDEDIDGWDSPNSEQDNGCDFFHNDGREFQQRSDSLETFDLVDSGAAATSSGRSREIESEGGEDMGIEGILSRLEKERMLSYAVESKEKGGNDWILGKDGEDEWRGVSVDAVADSARSRRSLSLYPGKDSWNGLGTMHFQNGAFQDTDETRGSTNPEIWRTWIGQRAGFVENEFEAAEIDHYGSGNQRMMDHNLSCDVVMDVEMNIEPESINGTKNIKIEPTSDDKENYQNQIHSRLQHMQQELNSVLHLLRSRTDTVVSHKGQGTSLVDLHKLSDAWEFQQTEVMKARDKLRSTRAKLAVLEGKMAMEIIEAQKIVEEKQKRIDNAQKALHVLRTACIVWPNSASEVLLAGSFDGWTSKRRMERSNSGSFTLNLKLYPGRYEIKFIVDGMWKIDPLRPIVNSNGYENNLLIIS